MLKSKLLSVPGIGHGFFDKHNSETLENPIKLEQIHSFLVLTLDGSQQQLPPADAMVTKTPGLKLTLKTADCAPVLLLDPQNKVIGAAHAGWKSAMTGILENTLIKMQKLGAQIDHIIAATGPCIHQPSCEIGDDMKMLFTPQTDAFVSQNHFDLPGYVAYRLKLAGVTQLDTIDIDTYTNENYHSYRRDPKNPARQFSAIWIE